MASMLSDFGTLYLLLAVVVLSHAVQIGIALIVAALVAGLVLLLQRPAELRSGELPPELSPAERLAVELAEEPSERIPAPRATTDDLVHLH